MKKFLRSATLVLLSGAFIAGTGCQKDEVADPKTETEEKIDGLWYPNSFTINGSQSANPNFNWRFDGCSGGTCTAVDFDGVSNTIGSMTYVVSTNGNSVVITDTDPDGGNWAGSWTITELTSTSLKMNTANNFAGDLTVEMDHTP